MEVGSGCDDCDQLGDELLSHVAFRKSKHLDHSVDVPFLVRRVLFASHAYLVRQFLLKLVVSNEKVVDEFLDYRFDIALVGDLVQQVQGLLLNDQVMVFQAISNSGLVSFDSVVVYVNHLLESLQRYEPHVVLPIHQEPAQNVDAENSEPLTGFDAHDGPHAFREHRVAGVLRRLGVGCDLSQNVGHFIGGFGVLLAEFPQQLQDAHLEEGVLHSANFVLRRVAAH